MYIYIYMCMFVCVCVCVCVCMCVYICIHMHISYIMVDIYNYLKANPDKYDLLDEKSDTQVVLKISRSLAVIVKNF